MKLKILGCVYFGLIINMFISCQTKETVKNSTKDIEEAKILTQNFYKKIIDGDTTRIYEKIDSSYINLNELKLILKKNHEEFGLINRVDINRVETENNIFNDNEFSIIYKIELSVYYDKSVNIETIGFIKKDSLDTKLFSYYLKKVK
jgi:hypothetical protein